MPDITPWASVEQFRTSPHPEWMPTDQRERVAAYGTYEDIYWSNPFGADGATPTLKLQRGEYPAVYMPDPQTIVNTTAYYLLRGLLIEASSGPTEYADALAGFLVREEFASRFGIAKLSGVCRGDWIMHLTADPAKIDGTKLSMHSVHPAAYVPVFDDDNLDQLNKVHLVERVLEGTADRPKEMVHRLTYEYLRSPGALRKVIVSEGVFDPSDKVAWYDPAGPRPARVIKPPTVLPEPIDTIPVYHFPNRPWQAEGFGSSELRGFEAVFATIGQQMTDGATALSLEGLGVWKVGQKTEAVYPGIAVQGEIERIPGITTIEPVLSFVDALRRATFEATGTSDISRGMVDISVAESGVALALRFVPTLAKLELRELKALDRLGQLWFDFGRWWSAYEGTDVTAATIATRLGDKLPFNVKEFLDALDFALRNNLVDRDFARGELRSRLGWDIPADMEARVLASASAMVGATDFGGASLDGEPGGANGNTGAVQQPGTVPGTGQEGGA
jgi:hypothetical protein